MSKSTEKSDAVTTNPNAGVVGVYRSTKQIFVANFIGGMAWGLGTVVGATLIVAILLFALTSLGGLPIIGSYLSHLAESISQGMKQ